MESGPRRNSSSDMMNVAQISIPTIRVALQKAPMIGTCLMNIWEGRKSKIYLRKSWYHRIKCTAATFLAAFMGRRPQNNVALATTTHRKLKKLFDGTSIQVRAQTINKCTIKMIQWELYNVRDPSWENNRKNREREHCSNLNCLCIQLWSIYTSVTSSNWKSIDIKTYYLCLIVIQFSTSRCSTH